jgi:hypothetical protein
MNIYGNSLENSFSGEVDINGDLVVTGDGSFENLTVSDTISTDTLEAKVYIVEEDLKIQDPIIELGVANTSDNLNLGLIEEFNDGAPKWAGLLRSKDDKKQYLLEGATPKPTSSVNVSTLPRGDLVVGSLTNANYTLPLADGTPGQIIATDGAGNLSFTDDTGGTLQTAYDLSTEPQITTTITNDTMVIKQGVGVPAPVSILEVQDSTGAAVMQVKPTETSFGPDGKILLRDTGQIVCSDLTARPDAGEDVNVVIDSGGAGTNATLKVGQTDVNDARIDIQSDGRSFLEFGSSGQNLIKFRPFGSPTSKLWCLEHIIANDNLVWAYDPFGGVDRRVPLKIESERVIVSKLNVNGAFTLPTVDGTAGQYLATDGAGVVSWESLPESSYGEQSFNGNATPTPTTVLNQWEDILGARVAGQLKDFTSDALTLTYTGIDTKTFKYSFQSTSEITAGANQQYEIAVFKNGVLAGGIMNFQMDDTAPYPRSTSTSAVVSLSTNDTITTKIRCTTTAATNIDVSSMMSNCVSVTSGAGGSPIIPDTKLNYSQTITTSAIDVSTETSLISSGLGSNTYLSNTAQVGSSYRIEASGFLQTNGAAQSISLRLRWGPNIVLDTGSIILDTVPSLKNWSYTGTICIRGTGPSGNSVGTGKIEYNNTVPLYFGFMNTTLSPLATDVNSVLDFSADWGLASPSNQIFCQVLNITQIS